jgi:uncharacterized membrane protein
MTTVELAVTIMRQVEDVFAVLSDVRNVPRWSESAIEEELLTAGPLGLGSRRRAVVKTVAGRTMTNEAEMIGFEPNRRMVVRTVGGGVTTDTVIDFVRTFGGTRLIWTVTFRLPRLLRFAGPLLGRFYRSAFQKDLETLKAMMESGEL